MTQETQLAEYNAAILDSAPGVRDAFMLMLADVPLPADNAEVSIVGAILKADTVEDLDKPWDSEGMREFDGQAITVKSITRRPSEFADGLGAYLGCVCEVEATGEELFVTTGSVSIVAQLVRAHHLGKLPLRVIPKQSERPSAKGYYPMHLSIPKPVKRS